MPLPRSTGAAPSLRYVASSKDPMPRRCRPRAAVAALGAGYAACAPRVSRLALVRLALVWLVVGCPVLECFGSLERRGLVVGIDDARHELVPDDVLRGVYDVTDALD